MELTGTLQEITGSSTGVIIGHGTFQYAFGTTQPSQPLGRWYEKTNEPFNYTGGFGSVWVSRDTAGGVDSLSIDYVLTV